jgi:hypothetical protein
MLLPRFIFGSVRFLRASEKRDRGAPDHDPIDEQRGRVAPILKAALKIPIYGHQIVCFFPGAVFNQD